MKKKGFTLIEILSVITIIAIVFIIMIPNILGFMESFKKSSFTSSSNGLIASAKIYYAEQTKVDKAEFNGKIIDFNDSDILIDIKGKKPTAGKLVIDADGNIALFATNGEYCAVKLKNSNDINVSKGTNCLNNPLAPNINLISKETTTKSLAVKTSCNSIDGTSVQKYEYNIGNGWVSKIVNGNYTDSYLFDNLISNKVYTVQTRCVNVNGISLNTSSNFTTKNIPAPTINVTPTGWTTNKNVTIVYPKGQFNYYYSYDGSNWIKATTVSTTSGNSITLPNINSNRVIYAKPVDRAKNSSYATLSISSIDTTAPNSSMSLLSVSTSKASVKTTCSDSESPVTKYEIYLDGVLKQVYNTSNTSLNYTYSSLKSGGHNLKVVCTNAVNLKNQASLSPSQLIVAPTITAAPSGWATSKMVTILYPIVSGEILNYYYSLDGGSTWIPSTSTTKNLLFTSNGNIIARVDDGTNSIWSTYTVTGIDTTPPSSSLSLLSVTTSKANVRAVCSDSGSPISKYEFYLDGILKQLYNTSSTNVDYTYSSLSSGIHNFKVVCTNEVNLKNESNLSSNQLSASPTITAAPSGWATSKTVTITYPTVSGENLRYYYSLNGGSTWIESTSTTKYLTFTSNGNVIALVSDGVNYFSSGTFTVTGIDREAPEVPIISNPTDGNWVTEDFHLYLYSHDKGSGIGKYQYSYNNSNWVDYSNSNSDGFNTPLFTNQMNQTIYFRSCDILNNCSGSSSTNIKLVKNVGVDYAVYVKGSFDNWSSGSNGATVGTMGNGFLIDRFKAKLSSSNIVGGNILYEVHVQNRGWRSGYSNDMYAPDSNILDCPNGDCVNLRIEAVKLSLSGELSTIYDVFYRVHVQEQGWLGWTKNGEIAGSQTLCKRVEALQIVLVKKSISKNESNLLINYLSGYDASKPAAVTLDNGATYNCPPPYVPPTYIPPAVPPSATAAQCNIPYTRTVSTPVYCYYKKVGMDVRTCAGKPNGYCTIGTTSGGNCTCKYTSSTKSCSDDSIIPYIGC